MFGFELIGVIQNIQKAQADYRRDLELQQGLWSLLPEQEAKIAEAKWLIERKELAEQRAHELEVARQSRPMNFWGNR